MNENEQPEIPFSADFELREKRIAAAEKKGMDYCLFCGRGTDKGLSVHMSTDGTLFRVDEDHDGEPDDQGWFGVGPECAKKVPSAFIAK